MPQADAPFPIPEVAWQESGRGPALLLFHAFPLDRRMWDREVAALAEEARVVRFDAPGFGESPPLAGDGVALTMEMLAGAGAAVLDALGIERAVVGGLSMGGYAALAFADLYPARLAGLLLADTRAGADDEAGRANRERQAQAALRDGAAAVTDALVPRLLAPDTASRAPALLERVRELAAGATPRGIAAALRGMAVRPDRSAVLPGIGVPTTIVCGEEDAVTPPAEARRLQAAIAGSELVLVPGVGHLANLEAPDAFRDAVRGLLGRCRERGIS